jgi:hypothetical protein
LRSIDSTSLEDGSQFVPSHYQITHVAAERGKLRKLTGKVTKARRRTPAAADRERLELAEYFECEFEPEGALGPIILITGRVPRDWLQRDVLDEPAMANAVLLKRLASGPTLWLSKEIAWFPGSTNTQGSGNDLSHHSPDPLLGKSLLGAHGMDLGLLDMVEARGRIRAQESTAFYEMLRAAGYIEPPTLVRLARDNLPLVKQEWEQRFPGAGSEREKALAREVVGRAGEGLYSVAMLFNDPQPQIGRLFVFDGVARRVTRVAVGKQPVAGSLDVSRRYGLDHYYELEVFTDDSQNYPLVFCMCELPAGFPKGGNTHVPVRVAGFFFKDWLYTTRGATASDESSGEKGGPRVQYAPLLVGRAPIVLATRPRHAPGRFVLGGVLLLALGAIAGVAFWFAREDQRFRAQTRAAGFGLEPGQSLNDLDVAEANLPMNKKVELPSSESM